MITTCSGRVILGVCALLILSCDEHAVTPHSSSDYFPLKESTVQHYVYKDVKLHDWNYLKEEILIEDTDISFFDTVKQTIHGDSTIEGRTYKKIVNEYPHITITTMVRREGSQYFIISPLTSSMEEYMFLDTAVPVNGTWEHIFNSGYSKAEYKVKATCTSKRVDGIVYNDVIALEVNYFFKNSDGADFTFSHSAKYYYANGFGEIYAYDPTPYSLRITSLLPR